MAKNNKKNLYVDKDELFRQLVKYSEDLKINPDTRMPDYIGKAIIDIVTNFSNLGTWNRYSYKDEMIAAGIEDCVKAARKFDPNRKRKKIEPTSAKNKFALARMSKNNTKEDFDEVKPASPLSFFSTTAYFAFCRVINQEKEESYVKHKTLQNAALDGLLADIQEGDEDVELNINTNHDLNRDLIEKFEKPSKKRVKKTKPDKHLELFYKQMEKEND